MFTRPDLPGEGMLIVGDTGFIGSHLVRSFHGSVGFSRADLDLKSPDLNVLEERGEDFSSFRIGIIAAGVSRIGICEDNAEETRRINVDGTLALARQFASRGMKTVWFSSDYVFNGVSGNYTDDAALCPLNHYGAQKADVERQLADATDGNCLILRIGKTYGVRPGDGTLLDEMASLLKRGRYVRAATDQVFNPTFVYDLVRAIHRLSTGCFGTLNCCNPEVVSRYELAIMMAEALGVDHVLVKAIRLEDLKESFARPKNTGMLVADSVVTGGFIPTKDSVNFLAGKYMA